jgi:hypothetical protein
MTDGPERNVLAASVQLRRWSQALGYLADEGVTDELLQTLGASDSGAFDRLMERAFGFGPPQLPPPECFEECRTIIGIINTGTGHFEEECFWSFIPPDLRDDDCQRMIAVIRQRCDPNAVREVLKEVGLLHCRWNWVPDVEIVNEEVCLTICPGPPGGPGPDPAL